MKSKRTITFYCKRGVGYKKSKDSKNIVEDPENNCKKPQKKNSHGVAIIPEFEIRDEERMNVLVPTNDYYF